MAGINDNLIPPKPGEVRNPYGAKGKDGTKGTHIKTLAKNILADMDTWERVPDNIKKFKDIVGNDKTYAQALIYAWAAKALNDPRFANILLELTDGKGKVEHSLDDSFFTDKELVIKIVGSSGRDNPQLETGDSMESPEQSPDS